MSPGQVMHARSELLKLLVQDVEPILDVYPLPELKGLRLFVTGATGFVGYWLLCAIHCLNLRQAGIQVVALSRSPDSFLANCPEFRDKPWLSWVKGDVRHYPFPAGSFDAFIHGAADTSPDAAADPIQLFDSIVLGSRRVMEHALAAGGKRLLLLSSGAIYGEQPAQVGHIRESDGFPGDPFDPSNAYGEGKRAMEMLGACFALQHGLETIVARCFTFVGHRLPGHLAIAQFIRDAQEKDVIAVTGDGRQERSFLYAADLAVWLLALLCRGRSGVPYNVGSPHVVSLLDAAKVVGHVAAQDKPVVVFGKVKAVVRERYVPDTDRAMNQLNLSVWTDLPSAIAKTAQAYRLASDC